MEKEVHDKLQNIPNLHVYWKEDIPSKYHYTYNRRIMPIVIEAAEGYILCNDDTCLTGGKTCVSSPAFLFMMLVSNFSPRKCPCTKEEHHFFLIHVLK